jgi:S-formylglutathione hydrolase
VARQRFPGTILIDQGEADAYLAEQLQPELFEQACAAAGQPLLLRRHPGYDHSYYFVTSFIDDHLRHHATALNLL